jgi:hypothetical protein
VSGSRPTQQDAIHLARLLRLDEITAVTIPSVDQEAARDLVRAREDCRGDPMRARHPRGQGTAGNYTSLVLRPMADRALLELGAAIPSRIAKATAANPSKIRGLASESIRKTVMNNHAPNV